MFTSMCSPQYDRPEPGALLSHSLSGEVRRILRRLPRIEALADRARAFDELEVTLGGVVNGPERDLREWARARGPGLCGSTAAAHPDSGWAFLLFLRGLETSEVRPPLEALRDLAGLWSRLEEELIRAAAPRPGRCRPIPPLALRDLGTWLAIVAARAIVEAACEPPSPGERMLLAASRVLSTLDAVGHDQEGFGLPMEDDDDGITRGIVQDLVFEGISSVSIAYRRATRGRTSLRLPLMTVPRANVGDASART